MKTAILIIAAMLVAATVGCTHVKDRTWNEAGHRSAYSDPGSVNPRMGPGVGTESQDIVSMTDEMMRDMLSCPALVNHNPPARIIVDEKYFSRSPNSTIDKRMITNRLRVNLNRAAGGRMTFVARHNQSAMMVENERAMKRSGVVDGGSVGSAAAPMGGDFRLNGSMISNDRVSGGLRERYHEFTFEMVSLETGQIVWSKMYEMRKTARDGGITYR